MKALGKVSHLQIVSKRMPSRTGRLLCWVGVHTWNYSPIVLRFGSDAYQRRTCSRCGCIKQKCIGWAAW